MLPEHVSNVLNESEEEEYDVQVKDYQIDRTLPMFEGRIDKWWSTVCCTGRYPVLCKIVFTLLSCFHGPQVESSFNIMGDILNARTGRMKVATYSAIQCTKYGLANQDVDAVKLFSRYDPVKDPVDSVMCKNLRSSASRYNKEKEDSRKALKENHDTLSLSVSQCLETKSKNKRDLVSAADAELEQHQARMINRKRKESLEDLVLSKRRRTDC